MLTMIMNLMAHKHQESMVFTKRYGEFTESYKRCLTCGEMQIIDLETLKPKTGWFREKVALSDYAEIFIAKLKGEKRDESSSGESESDRRRFIHSAKHSSVST